MGEQDFVIAGVSALAITIALTQVAKQWIESRWAPVISMIIGVLLSVAGSWGYFTPEAVIRGIVVGMIASGIYSSQKALRGK